MNQSGLGFCRGHHDQVIEIGRQYLYLATHVRPGELIAPFGNTGNQPVSFVLDRLRIHAVAADGLDSFSLDARIDLTPVGKCAAACAGCRWRE